MEIDSDGLNIFAIGPSGAGKTTIIQQFVFEKARGKHVPDDWCYVHNFDKEHKPRCLRLPAGKGREFRMDMQLLIGELKDEIIEALQKEEHETERSSMMEKFRDRQNELFTAPSELAGKLPGSMR
jgi:KaiC/GvpD/RAD55 family RecA-like ATPase